MALFCVLKAFNKFHLYPFHLFSAFYSCITFFSPFFARWNKDQAKIIKFSNLLLGNVQEAFSFSIYIYSIFHHYSTGYPAISLNNRPKQNWNSKLLVRVGNAESQHNHGLQHQQPAGPVQVAEGWQGMEYTYLYKKRKKKSAWEKE